MYLFDDYKQTRKSFLLNQGFLVLESGQKYDQKCEQHPLGRMAGLTTRGKQTHTNKKVCVYPSLDTGADTDKNTLARLFLITGAHSSTVCRDTSTSCLRSAERSHCL